MVQLDGRTGPMTCCGVPMNPLETNKSGLAEKHEPKVTVVDNSVTVEVGAVLHPYDDKHFIEFVYLHTQMGGQFIKLGIGKTPIVNFTLPKGDTLLAVYEYCNLHGLWYTAV